MDGLKITELERKAWRAKAAEYFSGESKLYKVIKKHAAIKKIREQPFFGAYEENPPTDTIKIRRPQQYYSGGGAWMG